MGRVGLGPSCPAPHHEPYSTSTARASQGADQLKLDTFLRLFGRPFHTLAASSRKDYAEA